MNITGLTRVEVKKETDSQTIYINTKKEDIVAIIKYPGRGYTDSEKAQIGQSVKECFDAAREHGLCVFSMPNDMNLEIIKLEKE